MALRWEVSFVDDESDETQHAFFSSKREADTWIKNVEVQQRYEPTGFEVVDGPVLRENSMKILAEGKHWPEDYIKTAYNTIKNSQLGQQSWYTDAFISQDVNTFVDEFKPLSHKNSNLGFFSTIIRWFIQYVGSSKEKYQEFIERKLDGIIGTLQIVLNDPSYDKTKDDIKQKWTLQQFEELQKKIADEAQASSDEKMKNIAKRDDYEVIPIYSYEELHKKFGGRWTGYRGESEWCHTNGKSTYESWTKDGTQMFFVLAKKNWKSIEPTKTENAYDDYGLSLIAILFDVVTGKLLNETLRWNHVIDPSHTNPGASVDKAFKNNWGELSQAVGMDVKAKCEKECKKLKEKFEDLAKNANEEVKKILSQVDEITEDTILKKIKQHLTSVVIPSNVTSIGNDAFFGCSELTSVTIPDSVASIGSFAFDSCIGLTSVTIPDSVISIRASAFFGCSGLASVTIGNDVTSIREYTFKGCSGLTSVTIGNSVTSIGAWAFSGCSNLTNMTIPDSVTSIWNNTFFGCSGLTSVTIPDSVTSIGDEAFYNCSGLTSVTIPDSVISIGRGAFYGCDKLANLTFKGKTIKQVKMMNDYPWGIKDESIIRCEDSNQSLAEDLELMLESCNAASGRQLMHEIASNGSNYDEVTEGDFAYDVAKRCIRDGMSLDGVWSVNNGTHYVASLFGGHNQSSLDRDVWVSYLQEVEQMVSNMLQNGCGSVWLVSFMNDPSDDAWELRIGFDLLSSPFEDDK